MPSGIYNRNKGNKGWFKIGHIINNRRKRSEEFKNKCSLRMKNRKVSQKTKNKIRKTLLIKKIKPPSRKGIKHNKETKLKIGLTKLGKKLSEKTKLKIGSKNKKTYLNEKLRSDIRDRNKGKNSHFWKGGLSNLSRIIKNHFKYKIWRTNVYKRDNYTCQECGQVGGKLNVHHKIAFSTIKQKFKIKTLKNALKCKLLFDLDNGITLCSKCHHLTINYGGNSKFMNLIGEINGKREW